MAASDRASFPLRFSLAKRVAGSPRRQGRQRHRALGVFEPLEERRLLAASGAVTVDVIPNLAVAVPPTAKDDAYVFADGYTTSTVTGSITVDAAQGLLANDQSASGVPLHAVLADRGTSGYLVLHSDGSFVFAPPETPSAGDIIRFTYEASDGTLSSNPATVTIMSHRAAIVEKIYEQVLHRAPDDAGWNYWIKQTAITGSYYGMAQAIFNSDEYLNDAIEQYYTEFFSRAADTQGLAYWRQVWRSAGGPDTIISGLVGSPEFLKKFGGFQAGWVADLYQQLLHRTPDQQGIDYWVEQIDSARITPYQIAMRFADSDESDAAQVIGWYEQYLGREPSVTEVSEYASLLELSTRPFFEQEDFLISAEYLNQPAPPAAGTAEGLPSY